MKNCCPELVALIFELACSEDLGQTARRLGLVSKSFRAIAEPIELRSIAVSGIEQLRGAVARVDKAHASTTSDDEGRQNFIVRHLFISELAKKHAILADTERDSFWWSDVGQEAAQFYVEHSNEFWRLADQLVQKSSSTLETLSLLSSSNWFSRRGSLEIFHQVELLHTWATEGFLWWIKGSRLFYCPKVLGVLSGIDVPNLVSLTVDHDAASEVKFLVGHGLLFKCPTLPALRRLRIVSYFYADKDGNLENAHPLFACLLSEFKNLEELFLCSPGLEAQDFGDMFPKRGETRYELLFQEWREQCFERTNILQGIP